MVDIMDGVTGIHPKTAYTGLHKFLQKVWDFVQHVSPDIGTAFQPIEDALHNTVLPYLFKGSTPQILRRAVIGMIVKQNGITIPDPTQTF